MTSSDSHASKDWTPKWTWIAPLAAWLLICIQFGGIELGKSTLGEVLSAALLGGVVFASVHHAEVIASKVGEPMGSIVLALAVTVIEVALIVSLMLSGGEGSDTLARDTVYATVMIVLNGIVGLALVVGGTHHVEQAFQIQGSSSALSVLGTLAVIALILPNYTLAVAGPFYAPIQLAVIGILSIALYAVFLFVQTIRHRHFFVGTGDSGSVADATTPLAAPSVRATFISVILLVLALIAVVLLAKVLAQPLEHAVKAAQLPAAVVGVVIAAIVLLPEGIAAVRAARANRLQTSLTLALGSAMATIGLTIPIVAFTAIFIGKPLALGLDPEDMVVLLLSLFIGTITLATGRTTILQGAVHLVLFAVFLMLSLLP